MLNASDAKLVKRCYLLPKVAWYSLAALFPTGALAILLVMVDNIALGSSGFGAAQSVIMFALMAAEGATCIGCGIAVRRAFGNKRWRQLEQDAIGQNTPTNANAAMVGGIGTAAAGRLVGMLNDDDLDALGAGLEMAGGAAAAYGFFETMSRMSKAAAAVAHANGMALPNLGATRAAVIGLPLLVLTLAFVPRFIDSAAQSSTSQEAAAHIMDVFDAALAPVCSYTMPDEPLEHRQDSGYRVSGNITDDEGDIIASVSIETDELGVVDGVVYNADVDVTLTPEENLAAAEDAFARFHAAIAGVDLESKGIELADTGLINAPVLPEEFSQAFLAGDYYTPLDMDLDNTGTLRAWVMFGTDPKEEFDEYTSPAISLFLQAR